MAPLHLLPPAPPLAEPEASDTGSWSTTGSVVTSAMQEPAPTTNNPTPGGEATSSERLALEAVQRQLAERRQHLAELEQLLEELPQIFENKFESRIQPLLERQRLLQEDNDLLQEQLSRLLPAAREQTTMASPPGTPPIEPGASSAASTGVPSILPLVGSLDRLRAATRRLLGHNDQVA